MKRDSDAIVDVVNAEDIGKLPNNTIGDVIASVPGIGVTRRDGEVDEIQLRGLDSVQTTIGGTPIESGSGRTATISDLPADLIKSVEVYKTRTPDQVEGGGGGTININLRGPTEFKGGLTVVAKAEGRFNNQSRKWNQTYTGIVNYRRQTGIGEVGALFGVTVNYNPTLESRALNGSLSRIQDRQVVGPNLLPIPVFAPNNVSFYYAQLSRKTPNYNGALEWRGNGNSVTIEGTYAAPTFDRYANDLFLDVTRQARSTNTLPALSNLVLRPGTNRLASATVSPVTPFGPITYIRTEKATNFLAKIKASHEEERFRVYAEFAYTGSNFTQERTDNRLLFARRPTYDIEFASDKYRFPMMNAVFTDLNLLDPKEYRFGGVEETQQDFSNRAFSSQVDFTLRMYDSIFAPFLSELKFGTRFSHRTSKRNDQTRGIGNLQIPLSDMPEGFRTLVPIDKGFQGTGVENNAQWLTYDRDSFRTNYDALRTYLSQLPGGTSFGAENPEGNFSSNYQNGERNFSAYGLAKYRFKLIFPIDGIVGVRMTSTELANTGFRLRTTRVNGANVTTRSEVLQSGSQYSVEPTVNAKVNFTRNLLLRLSYNLGIRRPNVDLLSPYIAVNDTTTPPTASSGNPDLQGEKTVKWDASLEWYFGRNRTGIITINPFYWKLQGGYSYFATEETLFPDSDRIYTVTRPYNAGRGYRRGVEMQGQTFFTFLPGILKNFGAQANYTFVASKQTYNSLPDSKTTPPAPTPLLKTPRNTFNVAGLFERGGLNARVTYNWNGRYLDVLRSPAELRYLSEYYMPRDWMDAAINYTIRSGPLKNISMSIQMQNVLASARRDFYGFPDQPKTVTYMARTYGGRIQYRF